MEPDPNPQDEVPPSVNMVDDWLFAECADIADKLDAEGADDGEHVGKWMIFSTPAFVDADWGTIKAAVERGELWGFAKVATRLIAGRSHVICVYTPDWRDRDDVLRHRESLRRLGFERPLSYKSNELTRRGVSGSNYRD